MQLQQYIFFLLINAFTKQTPKSTGVVPDEEPIPVRSWSLSPQEEHGMHFLHPLCLSLQSALWSLPYLRKQGLFITLMGLK